jgi:hypothetical protein
MPTVKNEPQETKGISLENVNSRADLSEFAQSKGYQVNQGRIPLDFYKKEVNLVNFARAIGYDFSEKTKAPSLLLKIFAFMNIIIFPRNLPTPETKKIMEALWIWFSFTLKLTLKIL